MIQITVIFFCTFLLLPFNSLFSHSDYKELFVDALEKGDTHLANNLLIEVNNKKGKISVEAILFYALSKFYIYPPHGETYIATLTALHQFRNYIQNNQQEIYDYFLEPYRPTSVQGTLLDMAVKRSYSFETIQKLFVLQSVAPITAAAQEYLESLSTAMNRKNSLTKAS